MRPARKVLPLPHLFLWLTFPSHLKTQAGWFLRSPSGLFCPSLDNVEWLKLSSEHTLRHPAHTCFPSSSTFFSCGSQARGLACLCLTLHICEVFGVSEGLLSQVLLSRASFALQAPSASLSTVWSVHCLYPPPQGGS